MMNTIAPSALAKKTRALIYQTTHRWHFYAGFFVIPFLLMLSVTGTVMLYDQQIQDYRYKGVLQVNAQGLLLSPSAQIAMVKQRYVDAQIKKYMPAQDASRANFIVIEEADKTLHVAINPYTGSTAASDR